MASRSDGKPDSRSASKFNPAVKFGQIYGILGKPPEVAPDAQPKPFPHQVSDPEVDGIYGEMKAEAAIQGTEMDDLIITRKGATVNGKPVGRELRLVFTDGDAVYFREKKQEIVSNLNLIENLQQERDAVQIKLKGLKENRSGTSYSLYSVFGTMVTNSKDAKQFAKWDEEYKQAIHTLKIIGPFAANADVVYQRDIKPILRTIKQDIEGYIQLDQLKALLQANEFDLKTGSDLSSPPFAFWWHKTD